MKIFLRSLLVLIAGLYASAVMADEFAVKHIEALSTPGKNAAHFQGLEFLASPIHNKAKNRVNVFYLHGIGYTENPDKDQLADDFLTGIARAYGQRVKGQIIEAKCGDAKRGSDHIYIRAQEPHVLETMLPGSTLTLDRLVCMDKQVLQVDDAVEFVIYRIFWDEIFWNKLQYPHIGQDTDRGAKNELAAGRRKYNRLLKDELMNYGMSDAVMYLGPAGEKIRSAIRGAMCSASLDAGGYSFADQGRDIKDETICRLAKNTEVQTNQFAFVSESLGSKITYDVLRSAMTDGRDGPIDDMVKGSEFYMLANQIALLSLSDLSRTPKSLPPGMPLHERPKIIAMSEVNDFMTYELIPFFKQLWTFSNNNLLYPLDADSHEARLRIVNAIGFDVVDMRLEFADKIVPLMKGFTDPLQAHSGHANETELMRYVLCGARGGKLNTDGCLATAEFYQKSQKLKNKLAKKEEKRQRKAEKRRLRDEARKKKKMKQEQAND
ncbi:MAG: hypothetical protein ACPGVT_11540 [Maricaulaceae bacterium]